MASTGWLSAAARIRLREELKELEEKLQEAEEALNEARKRPGDTLDNGALSAALDEQGILLRRYEQVNALLKIPERPAAATTSVEKAAEGTVVTVKDNDEIYDVLIGHSANRSNDDMIVSSPDAPLGGALIGATIGEIVTYRCPAGAVSVEVLAIRLPV